MKSLLLHSRTAIMLAFASLTIAVVLAFAPSTWPTMMMRSFLPQWITLFAVTALWLLLRRRWRDGLVAAAGSLMIAPILPPSSLEPTSGSGDLRVAHFNVLQTNRRHADVIATMLASDADVVSVQEVDPRWAAALIEGLSGTYPYHVIEPRTNCYGIALFSRLPLQNAHVVKLGASPMISAVLRSGDERLRLLCVHTSSPGSPGHFAARNAQLDLLQREVNNSPDEVIVVGDLNAAPWDRDLQRCLAATGLRSHARVDDPTFPSVAHLALIPIDHVLTGARVDVLQRSLHIPGSDHRGLVADLSIARR